MIYNILSCSTATNSSPSKLSKYTLNKAIIDVDFAKIEQAFIYHYTGGFMYIWSKFNTIAMSLKLKPNLRRLPTMTKKEIKIQKALGTLSYKEWMKLKGIIFDDSELNNYNKQSPFIKWWYFPLPRGKKVSCRVKTITINSIEHYPVADGYIDELYNSMAWRKWTEEEFAREIIKQCYSCMSLETIDH